MNVFRLHIWKIPIFKHGIQFHTIPIPLSTNTILLLKNNFKNNNTQHLCVACVSHLNVIFVQSFESEAVTQEPGQGQWFGIANDSK